MARGGGTIYLMKRHNQNGFGAVEGLLIIVIVGLLGFVGWYVWHSKNQADKNLSNASNASIVSTPTSNSQQYLTIKEWGVKAKLSDPIKDATYTIAGKNAWLSTKKLDANQQCKAYNSDSGFPSFQSIERLAPTDGAPGDYTEANALKVSQDAQDNPTKYEHIDNYYYYFLHGNGFACNAQTVEQFSAFESAFKSLQAI